MRRLLPLAALVALAAYYLYFAQVSLRAGLTHDDLMNMHNAVTIPLRLLLQECAFFFLPALTYRPAGALFYRVLHALFGPEAFPLHLSLVVLWGLCMAVLYDTVRQLARSREVALLTVLLAVHHSNRPFYYYNSGFCYDILCHLFYFAAFAYYLRARERGRLTGGQLMTLSALLVLALGSKEMAVSLPVVIAAVEWWRDDVRDWRFAILGGLMAVLYVFGRVLVPEGIAGTGGYGMELRPALYLRSWEDWLTHLTFLAPAKLALGWVAAFLAAICAAAWASGDRALRVAAVLMLAGVGPVAFLQQSRGLEAVCIPLAGLMMTLAWWATRLSWVVPWRGRAIALFMLVLALQWRVHATRQAPEEAMLGEGRAIGHAWASLRRATPGMRAGDKVLVEAGAFPQPFVWTPTFMLRIDHGAQLDVVQAATLAEPPDPTPFEWVLTWSEGAYVARKSPGQR